jgi:hypothetical protein
LVTAFPHGQGRSIDKMKHILKIALLLAIVACGTGCTTGYWVDRGRDAADVFTFTVGAGGGAGARVGPFALGLGVNANVTGLQDGIFFTRNWEQIRYVKGGGSGYLLLYSFDNGMSSSVDYGIPSTVTERRKKAYRSFHFLGVPIPDSLDCEGVQYYPHYFTQIEAFIGLGGTIKIGFNPGELFDLILGFIGVDIYGDDLERRKQRKIEQENSG